MRSPRVYLECTTTCASRYRTGIQRTVRGIVNAAQNLAGPSTCVPVVYNGRFLEAVDRIPAPSTKDMAGTAPNAIEPLRRAFYESRLTVARRFPFAPVRTALYSPRLEFGLRRGVNTLQNSWRWIGSFRHRAAPIPFAPGDVLVLLDATWGIDLSREMVRARAGGARIFTVVQDLIPIDHPDIAPEGLPLQLDAWLRRVIPLSDGLIAISRTVADDLRRYLRTRVAPSAPVPRVDSFYPGAGFDVAPAKAEDLARVRAAFGRNDGVYLVVGTIEPRKDVARILTAFDRLWAEGLDPALMLLGRAGWRSYDLIDRLRKHPERGRRLFWFEDGSDAELDFAYRHAVALIFASCCEGFGLPLVEAMRYGLPVLASDIPIFREIGGDYPRFFPPSDERAIGDAIRAFDAARRSGAVARRAPRPWLSWSDSAQILLDKVTAAR